MRVRGLWQDFLNWRRAGPAKGNALAPVARPWLLHDFPFLLGLAAKREALHLEAHWIHQHAAQQASARAQY